MTIRSMILLLVFAVSSISLVGGVLGQEGASAEGAVAEGDRTGVASGTSEADKTIREQTIYIPYDKLRKVFETEGRGVFLPYEQFQKLWNAARKQLVEPESPKQPVDALIREIDSEATIDDKVVNVSATLKVEILEEGWVTVPLRLRNSAIRSAVIAGQPARIVFDKATGYQLLYRKEGEQPAQIELKIEYSQAYTQSSVSFEAPQAPINRWRIHVPEAGMAVQVEPMIAATQTPEAKPDAEPAQTDLLAFVGVSPTVRITWNPKAEGASGLAAFATVKTEQQLTISEGVARSTIQLDYEISRSTLTQLVLEVPGDQKVVNVFDRNVKRWRVEPADADQKILVDLFEATQGKQALVVELEKFSDATESTYEVTAALVRAVGVGRQQGIVVARLESGFQGEAIKRVGLLQLDQNDLPPNLRKAKWGFAYRYGAVPYELRLRVEKVLPRISVTELIDAQLSSDKLVINWQGVYSIEEAGVFQLQVDIPDGFEVRSIRGKAIGKVQAAAVDAYHRVADDGPTWRVNLSKKAFGQVGLTAELQRPLEDPNLLTPTGQASTIAIPLPRATATDVEFSQGSVVVSAPESLRVNPAKTEGLRSVSFSEAYKAIPATPGNSALLNPALAFSFATGATELSVTAERRRPQVTVRQALRAEIEAGVVKYHANFYYDVKYSGVKSLRIDIPSSLSTDIRNTSKTLRKEEIAPQPDDVAERYTAWSFAGETELLGPVEVPLEWEQKIDELGVGKSYDISIPHLTPMDLDRATGQIVISKSESIDIQPTGQPKGLRPIDPQNDVMPQAKVDNAAMAFEFVGDWTLTIQATRYELETSKLTSMECGLVRIVALGHGESSASRGELSVQAIYRVRSGRQRLAISLPKDHRFDAQPLRINGKAVTPEKGSDTTIYAPLVDQAIDQAFLLELRYTVDGRPSQLDVPSFPDDPAVQRVYLCVYLPKKTVLLASDGPWTDERGEAAFAFGVGQEPRDGDEFIDLVAEDPESAPNSPVAAGLKSGANAARTFPIGKSQLYAYSTLRPEAAPDGSLRLTTMDRRLFNGLMIMLIVLMGLPLYGRSLRLQISLLLLITIALLLIGVFIPELARTVFGSVFPIALAVLLLVWFIGHVNKLRHRPRPPVSPPPSTPFAPDSSDVSEASDGKGATANEASHDESPPADSPAPAPEPGDENTKDEGGRDHA